MERERKNRGEAIYIITAVIAVLLIAGLVTLVIVRQNRKYSTGELDGTTYTNKWAGVKVEVGSEYKINSVSGKQYQGYDIGVAVTNQKATSGLFVMSQEREINNDDIEALLKAMIGDGSTMLNLPISKTTTVQTSLKTERKTIAGESYTCIVMTVPGGKLVLAARAVHDNGIFFIEVVTTGNEDPEDYLRLISKL